METPPPTFRGWGAAHKGPRNAPLISFDAGGGVKH
jgi:hypothetical protein